MENNNLENVTEILDDKQLEEKKKKATLSIVYYFIIMYFFGTVAQVILMFIAPFITGVELMNPETMEIYQPNMDFIMSWTQIIIYITLTVGLVILSRKYLLNYFEDFKNNWKKLSLEIIIGFGIFFGTTIISNLFLQILKIESDSANQEAIISMLQGDYKFIITFIIVVLGPLCEEIIFRHSFFSLFKKNTNKWMKILISGAIFGAIHFVMAIINYATAGAEFSLIITEFLLGLTYVASGVALGYIYSRSKENLVPVLLIHIFNNLIAASEIFLM